MVWKVVVCGEAVAGKTQLVSRIAHDKFAPEYGPTAGVDFGIKQHSAVSAAMRLTLHLWDLAGQARFRSILLAYFRTSDLVLLVYDVTDLESAEGLSSTWHGFTTQPNASSKHVVVVGNKADRLPDGGTSLMTGEALQRGALLPDAVAGSTAAVQTANAFCEKEQLPHFVVSAKTGAGVDRMMREAVQGSLRMRGHPCWAVNGGIRLPLAA